MKKIILVLTCLAFLSCSKEDLKTPVQEENNVSYNDVYDNVEAGFYYNRYYSWGANSMISEIIKDNGVIIWKTPFELLRFRFNGSVYSTTDNHKLYFINKEKIELVFNHGNSMEIIKQ